MEQWQDELWEKFRLEFQIMTNDKLTAAITGNWLNEVDFVIARLDKLSRDEDLRPKLLDTHWDLVIFDEAHKLSASRFGSEIKRTQRFHLARALSPLTRHLLLMTATPHNGKEEDFQLFLSLLDADRFEGVVREETTPSDPSDIMRRLIKEQLVRFDGTPLFPQRRAYTVNYELSDAEIDLYEQVTTYVRQEFNRAERLDNTRRGTVGFALTVLQRRLASSPAAIHSSLQRRRTRLEEQLSEIREGNTRSTRPDTLWSWFTEEDLEDLEDAPEGEQEEIEEEALLRSSTAETIEELTAEIETLTRLEAMALQLVRSGPDKKWGELSRVIQDDEYMYDATGARRKLVIFTEHKDTLRYLHRNLSSLIGDPDAIVIISGGMPRDSRRHAETRFRQDPSAQILLATDAAGEGINLQRAHLMVNYDLPWNPNRLEQRFGRIHRIGQTEVCHLWNLVAHQTREGQVFERLLRKLSVESEALGGRVFDVLGTIFDGSALRDLMIRAIRGGDPSDVQSIIAEIEHRLDHETLQEIMEERALAFNSLENSTVQRIRRHMERTRLQRLQPYYIEAFFREALRDLGGTMRERERYRFEIRHVPARIRSHHHSRGRVQPLLSRYDRVTFHTEGIEGPENRTADLLAPGHPLLDTIIDITLAEHLTALRDGTILIDRNSRERTEPYAIVVLEHTIKEGFSDGQSQQQTASQRLYSVEIESDGSVYPAGPAPWLDLDPPTAGEVERVRELIEQRWTVTNIEDYAVGYIAEHQAVDHRVQVQDRRTFQVEKTRREVVARLSREIAYWDHQTEELRVAEQAGKRNARLNSENARRRRDELQQRLAEWTRELDAQGALSSQIPVIRTIAMETVMAAERVAGNTPVDVSADNRGYDIESTLPDGSLRFLEVKGRISTADEVTVTHNEMRRGFNELERFVFAIVLVDKAEHSGKGGDAVQARSTSQTVRSRPRMD